MKRSKKLQNPDFQTESGFSLFAGSAKNSGFRHLLVEQSVEMKTTLFISTEFAPFSLNCNILHRAKSGRISYICRTSQRASRNHEKRFVSRAVLPQEDQAAEKRRGLRLHAHHRQRDACREQHSQEHRPCPVESGQGDGPRQEPPLRELPALSGRVDPPALREGGSASRGGQRRDGPCLCLLSEDGKGMPAEYRHPLHEVSEKDYQSGPRQ